MKVLLTIAALVLMSPVLLLIGFALGPAALVILFISGFALAVSAVIWLASTVAARPSRHPRLHT